MKDRNYWLAIMVVTVIGFVDSIYLSWVKISSLYALCGPFGDCETVNTSPYSEILGVPIAFLGAGAYLVIFMLLYLEKRSTSWADMSQLAVFGISLVGVLYSAYLTYIELFVIRAICPYCVVSAIALLIILIFAVLRLRLLQSGAMAES